MNKKIAWLVTLLLLAAGDSAEGQQPKQIPRVGWLTVSSKSVLPERYEAFRQGLRDLGYIEGRNIVIERGDAGGKIDRLADAAAELVRLKVEVIVTTGTTGSLAAKQATSMVAIVMTTGGDPVREGPHCQSCSAGREHHRADKHFYGVSRETT